MMINILKILQNHSDRSHRLDLTEIVQFLESEFGMQAERKAVKRNLMDLEQCGFDIQYQKIVRSQGQKSENIICKDYYLEREFTDGELNFLIDTVLFSPQIAQQPTKDLVRKLSSLGSISLRNSSCGSYDRLPHTQSQEFFLNLEELTAAIRGNHMVSFVILTHSADNCLLPVPSSPCVVNPYWIVMSRGNYYLMAAPKNGTELDHFRIDRMTRVQILENSTALPIHKIPNAPRDPGDLLRKHSCLGSGPVENIRFAFPEKLLDEVADQFGQNIQVARNGDGVLCASILSTQEDVFPWALQHGAQVTVLQPRQLRDRLREASEAMYRAYHT